MTKLNIVIKNTPVEVDLSKFLGLNSDRIYWGDDDGYTNNTYTHTYNQPGSYSIIGNFEDVYEITNNFTILNLYYIDITNLDSLTKIGNNFLNNCSNLSYLNLYPMNISEIGSNFLDGCDNLKVIKLQHSFIPLLTSWGNIDNDNIVKLLADKQQIEDYKRSNWCPDLFTNIHYTIDNIPYTYQNNINDMQIRLLMKGNTIVTNNKDLEHFTNLKNAIINKDILVESDIDEIVDPETRRVYKDEEALKKTEFILQTKYYFKDNPNHPNPNIMEYISTRLVTAKSYDYNNIIDIYIKTEDISIIEGKDYYTRSGEKGDYTYTKVDDPVTSELSNYYEINPEAKRYLILVPLNGITYFTPMNEDISEIYTNTKYLVSDPIQNISDTVVNEYDTEIQEFKDYEEPPYCRGWIEFGVIDNRNLTNIPYNGDVETGLTFEIKCKGVCKNLIIYDADVNEELGRREFIRINTDKLPEGKLLKGDYIYINTNQGEKSSYLIRNGEKLDILKYIDRSSSWLKIFKGDNLFYAATDDDPSASEDENLTIYNVDINVVYNNKYEGV